MNNSIVVITQKPLLSSLIKYKFENIYNIAIFDDILKGIDFVYNSLPNLLIADISQDDNEIIKIINTLKADSVFGQIPVLLIINDHYIISSWNDILAEDYIRLSHIDKDLSSRIQLCLIRAERIMEVNPLTRLPGNITIIRQLQKKIENKEIFAIAYADLDYFKPYNDIYGFARGDEVIKMLGRLIYNIVRDTQPSNSFVGHIGGDDFIYMMDVDLIEKTSKMIIEHYEKIIPSFYDYEDRKKGYLETIDREGVKKTFPVMSLSIGITHNKYKSFLHYGEVAQLLAEMKKYAKSVTGSYFIADRRR